MHWLVKKIIDRIILKKRGIMKRKEKEVMKVIGMLLIAFAVIDFVASYQGINLTLFLGDFSRFSPIIIGLIGAALMRS